MNLDDEQFERELHAGYARLRADPLAWAEFWAEFQEWDAFQDSLEPWSWSEPQGG